MEHFVFLSCKLRFTGLFFSLDCTAAERKVLHCVTVFLNEAIMHTTEKKKVKTNLLCVRILLTKLF